MNVFRSPLAERLYPRRGVVGVARRAPIIVHRSSILTTFLPVALHYPVSYQPLYLLSEEAGRRLDIICLLDLPTSTSFRVFAQFSSHKMPLQPKKILIVFDFDWCALRKDRDKDPPQSASIYLGHS
jgi:hypothetical protein